MTEKHSSAETYSNIGTIDEALNSDIKLKEVTKEDDLCDKLFFEGIYEDAGCINSSQVIEYMKRSLLFEVNPEDLMELSYLLDPEQRDLEVDLGTCKKLISEWIAEKYSDSTGVVVNESQTVSLTESSQERSFRTREHVSLNGQSLEREDYKRLEETILELQGEIQNLVGQNKRLNEEYGKMRDQRDSAEEVATSHLHTVEAYTQRMRSMQKLIDRREQTLSDNDDLKSTVSRLYEEKFKLSSQIKQSEKLNTNLQNQLFDLELKLLKAATDLEAADKQMNDIQSSLYKEKHLWARTEEEKEIIETRLDEKCRHIEELHGIMENLKKTNTELDDHKQELEQQLTSARLELTSIRLKAKQLQETEHSLKLCDVNSKSAIHKVSIGGNQSLAMELKPQLESEKDLPSPLCEKEYLFPILESPRSRDSTLKNSRTYDGIKKVDQWINKVDNFSGYNKTEKDGLPYFTEHRKTEITDDLGENSSDLTSTPGTSAEQRARKTLTATIKLKGTDGNLLNVNPDSVAKGSEYESEVKKKIQSANVNSKKLSDNYLKGSRKKTKHRAVPGRRRLEIHQNNTEDNYQLSSLLDALMLHSPENGNSFNRRNGRKQGSLAKRWSLINPSMPPNAHPKIFKPGTNSLGGHQRPRNWLEYTKKLSQKSQTSRNKSANTVDGCLRKQTRPAILETIEESADGRMPLEPEASNAEFTFMPIVDLVAEKQICNPYIQRTSAFSSKFISQKSEAPSRVTCNMTAHIENIHENIKGSYSSSISSEGETSLSIDNYEKTSRKQNKHKTVLCVSPPCEKLPNNNNSPVVLSQIQENHVDNSCQHISVHATYADFIKVERRNPIGCNGACRSSCIETDSAGKSSAVNSNLFTEKGCLGCEAVESNAELNIVENPNASRKNKWKSLKKTIVKNVPKAKINEASRNIAESQPVSGKLETITEIVSPNEQYEVKVEVKNSCHNTPKTEVRIVSAKGQQSLLSRKPRVRKNNSKGDLQIAANRDYSQVHSLKTGGQVVRKTLSDEIKGVQNGSWTDALILKQSSMYCTCMFENGDSSWNPLVFPNISDDILKSLGLSTNSTEQLTGEEIQDRFARLSLAFKTDKLTLSKRLQIQQRCRDHTEQNVNKEMLAVKGVVQDLTQLCDEEHAFKLVSQLQRDLDVLEKCTLRLSSTAEAYGAVQQENRMSLAMELMIQHVENLKKSYEKDQTDLEDSRTLVKDSRGYLRTESDRGSFKANSFKNRTVSLGRHENMKEFRRLNSRMVPQLFTYSQSISMESSCAPDSPLAQGGLIKELSTCNEDSNDVFYEEASSPPSPMNTDVSRRTRKKCIQSSRTLRMQSATIEDHPTDIVSERPSLRFDWSLQKLSFMVALIVGIFTILCAVFVNLDLGSVNFSLSYYNGAQI